jgi:hypothetical protein
MTMRIRREFMCRKSSRMQGNKGVECILSFEEFYFI